MIQINLIKKLRQYSQYLRLRPFDTSIPAGFAKERQRKILLTIIANFFAKGISLLTSLISIRFTVNYLGPERFGIWALISSFTAMLTFADLGIGNGLLNSISDAYGKDDRQGASKYVSSAFFMLLFLSILFAIIFVIGFPFITWTRIFNISSPQTIAEVIPAMSIFIICFLINIPLGVIQRIRLGYQEGFINSVWLALGSIGTLIAILVLIHFRAGLPSLVFALVGFPIITQLGNGSILIFRQNTWLKPRLINFSFSSAKHILRLGFLFFVLQAAVAISYESDGFIISQFLGIESVTQYAIPKRLFSIFVVLLSLIMNPLWPAYGEAIARRDIGWVKKTLFRSLSFSIITGIFIGLVLLFFSKPILEIWVGDAVTPTLSLLVGFTGWLILSSIMNTFAMFMNGASVMSFQLIMASTMTIVNITASILLVQRIGVAGPIWGTVISLFLCQLFPTIWFVLRFIKKLEKNCE